MVDEFERDEDESLTSPATPAGSSAAWGTQTAGSTFGSMGTASMDAPGPAAGEGARRRTPRARKASSARRAKKKTAGGRRKSAAKSARKGAARGRRKTARKAARKGGARKRSAAKGRSRARGRAKGGRKKR